MNVQEVVAKRNQQSLVEQSRGRKQYFVKKATDAGIIDLLRDKGEKFWRAVRSGVQVAAAEEEFRTALTIALRHRERQQ